ncbi:MAG: PAS domain S-box protein [Candidatus Sulfotelmatobacter sp.]
MEQKKAQTVGPDSELLYAAFKACPMGIAIENLEGQPLFVNPSLCAMLGLSEEEMLGKHRVEFSPPEAAAKDWALFEQLRAGSIDHYQIDKRFLRRDGSTVWGRLSISLLKGATPPLAVAMVEDITEKKKAEKALLRYAAIVESSDDAIVGLDTNAIITNWNKGAERLFGYSASEAIGQNILFLSQANARDDNKAALIKKVWQGEVMRHHETVRRRKDGTGVDISLTVSPMVDVDGQIVGASGIARDITERKRAQERLREYEQVVEVLGDRIMVVDREYRYVIANAAFLNYRGFEKDQVIGHTVAELLGKETFEADIKEQFDQCFQGKVVRYEVKYNYPKLGARNISAAYFPIQGPLGIDRIACVLRDITERKAAEEALRESEERFRLVANSAPVMIWMSGLDTKPTYFNQLWLDFTGFSQTDLLNGLAGIVHPEDYLQFQDVYCRGFDQRQPFRKEFRLRRHDGQYRWMLNVGVPRFFEDGSFAGFIGTCIDVTDRKLADDALTNMSRKLVEAQEQERARIARELHDDINQRLAMLGIDLQQLREHYAELPVEISSRMKELQEQTTGIANDVQSLSHELHSSKLEYLGAVGGMKSWCKEFSERQALHVEFKSPDAEISLPKEIGLCFFRVLQEALHNAAKHSGVKRIEVQLREDSGEIHLVISDSGRGFDVGTAMQGRGLGLASMQERVRLANGRIEIQSKPMGGTTVHVRVPFGSEKVSERAVG